MPHELTVNPYEIVGEDYENLKKSSRASSTASVLNTPQQTNSSLKSFAESGEEKNKSEKNLAFIVESKPTYTPNPSSRPQTPSAINHDFDTDSDEEEEIC